jgi:hypothetical protein
MSEMAKRGFKVSGEWMDPFYRGKRCGPWTISGLGRYASGKPIYLEHNDEYLAECVENLKKKGIILKR